jgi:hypothetical protein
MYRSAEGISHAQYRINVSNVPCVLYHDLYLNVVCRLLLSMALRLTPTCVLQFLICAATKGEIVEAKCV